MISVHRHLFKTKNMATKTANTKPAGLTGKMENSEFHEFFVDELKDIYWAEKHLVKALPKMQKAATSSDLAAAFEKHTNETKRTSTRLSGYFALLDEKAAAKKCDAMAGLLVEATTVLLRILKKAPAYPRRRLDTWPHKKLSIMKLLPMVR